MDKFELKNQDKNRFKRRYANRHKINKPDSNLIYKIKRIDEDFFKGDLCYYNFKDAGIKISTPAGKIIIDDNYKLLEFYNYNCKVKLSAFYDNNNNIIEWYFDIANQIGKENGVPYEDDLYLDVVVRPDGEIILLDEEELKNALDKHEINEKEYKIAYEELYKLIKFLEDKKEGLEEFTNKYLNYFNNINI